MLNWLNGYGFSISPADCEFGRTEEIENYIKEDIVKMKEEIRLLGPEPTNPSKKAKYEIKINKILDRTSVTGKKFKKEIMKDVKDRPNTIGSITVGGAKGSLNNAVQIGIAGGQFSFLNSRLIPKISENKRCFPTQPCREVGDQVPPEERGYCVNSYFKGVSPTEVFTQAYSAREGQFSTSNSTALVGVLQGNITKALENIIVTNDGSVRSIDGKIYLMSVGGDGLDSKEMLKVKNDYGETTSFSDFGMIIDGLNSKRGWITEEYKDIITKNEEQMKTHEAKFEQMSNDRGDVYISRDSDYEKIKPTKTKESKIVYKKMTAKYSSPKKNSLTLTTPQRITVTSD